MELMASTHSAHINVLALSTEGTSTSDIDAGRPQNEHFEVSLFFAIVQKYSLTMVGRRLINA